MADILKLAESDYTDEAAKVDLLGGGLQLRRGTWIPKPAADGREVIETFDLVGLGGNADIIAELGRIEDLLEKARTWPLNPVQSAGTCARKWILGKRFLLEEFDGGELGLPFQALAVYGYDAFEKKYTSVWVDTMSTAITTSQGICQKQCETIAFTGQHGDPWTGTKRPSRGVTRLVNDNQHVLELYEPGADGKEFKILEIVYTRKQPAD